MRKRFAHLTSFFKKGQKDGDDKVQRCAAQMHEDAKSGIITLKTPLRAGGRDVTSWPTTLAS